MLTYLSLRQMIPKLPDILSRLSGLCTCGYSSWCGW